MDKNFRDMCAIMAMQGLIVQDAAVCRDSRALAQLAFEKADAMVAERERRERDAKADRSGHRVV